MYSVQYTATDTRTFDTADAALAFARTHATAIVWYDGRTYARFDNGTRTY